MMRTIAWRCAVPAVLALAIAACKPTLECGSWTFSGTPKGNAFPLSSSFTLNPETCHKSCRSAQDVMIQMTWVYDADLGTNIYASDQPQGGRSTSTGWSIDQLNGWAYAYYGVLNDGTLDTGYNVPGGVGTPNTLFDEPGGWGKNTYFYAVDVAACYKSPSCDNTIGGYYFWSYILDDHDVGQTFITAPAWKDLDKEFQAAVSAWNAWAPSTGSQNDGVSSTVLAHAKPLPSLSDL